jgi:hypothetical protein
MTSSNKIIIAFLAFTSLVLTNGFSQEKLSRFKVSEITLMPSVFAESNPSASITDFYKLAPNSELLPLNYSDYHVSDYSNSSGGFSTSALLGIKFLNKDGTAYRANPIFRAGITYSYAQNISSYARHEERTTYDTLISSSTGDVYYIDSVSLTYLDMNYQTQQIKLDLSLLFRTNPEARWNLFGGIGAQVGTSINAQTKIHKYEGFYLNNMTNPQSGYYTQNNNSDHTTETTTNQNIFSASIYTPMGVDFRISNKNEFFQKIHLFYEMRPALNITSIPELRTTTNAAFGFGFGMKVSWN